MPQGSTGGLINVITKGGSAATGAKFIVRKRAHRSRVSFNLKGHLSAFGSVSSFDSVPVCAAARVVTIQRNTSGSWVGIHTLRSGPRGAFHTALPDVTGSYRAVVKIKTTLQDRCGPVVSRALRHHAAGGGGGGGGGQHCTPGYSPCLPLGPSDYDCYGGGGNGPAYTKPGVVYHVSGSDPYGLDSDNDGLGCESN